MKKNPCCRLLAVFCASATFLVSCFSATAQVLQHQYSFWNATNATLQASAVDLVGTNNGTLNGDATITGTQLQLDGSAYVQMQAGLITNDTAVTIESWGDYPDASVASQQGNWANLFDFGTKDASSADEHSISFCVDTGGSAGTLDAAICDFDNANNNRENNYPPGTPLNGQVGAHVVVVFVPQKYSAIYINGVLASRVPIQSTLQAGTAFGLAETGIWDIDNLIGADNWGDADLIANIDEFRVWNGALSGLQIAASAQNGFTSVNTNYGTINGLQLTFSPQLVQGGQEPISAVATASLITGSADMTPYCTFLTGNTNIATVDASGYIHGVGIGSTAITGSLGGVTSAPVTVTILEPVSILAHRYSFSDSGTTVQDSIGTANGILVGNAYETNGVVVLDGTNGTYVDLSGNLGTNGLLSTFKSATMDFWATFGNDGDWSYAYSIGNQVNGAGSDYIYFTFSGGNGYDLNDDGYAAVNNSPNLNNRTVHVTTICDPNSGVWSVYTNGVIGGYITGDFQPLANIATNVAWIGRSLWSADPYATANFDEFRVYNGTLTPQQIATANQNGPNNTNINPGTFQNLSLPASSTLQWRQSGTMGLRVNYTILTNWDILGGTIGFPAGMTITSSDTNIIYYPGTGENVLATGLGSATVTATYQGFTNSEVIHVVRPATAAILTHRYSFNDAPGSLVATDSVGTLNGTLMGSASISGGKLILPNATSVGPGLDYMQLPYGIITNSTGTQTNYNDPTSLYNDASVTVEAWATFYPGQYTWAEIFDFGNTDTGGLGEYDIHVCIHAGNNDTYIGISDSDNANVDYQFEDVPGGSNGSKLDGSTNIYIAAVFNPPAGYLAIYTNGVLYGENSSVSIPMAGVYGVLNKVGADLWPDPGLQGTVDEFRIYNGVLTPDQIAADQILGPNQLAAPAVSMTAAVSSGNLIISWPVSGSSGYSLYSSSTLGAGATWTAVGTAPTVVGQNNQVSVPIGAADQFFRLKN